MPSFFYTALDPRGKTVKGTISGATITEAARTLRSWGLSITALEEAGDPDEGASAPSPDLLTSLSFVTQADVVLLLKQMAAMLRSGISLVPTLSLLERQTSRRKLKFILARLRSEVETGKPLSEAMALFPRTFPSLLISMVKVGETTGLLETSLERVAALWEEKLGLFRRILSTLIYPALVFAAALGAVAFLVGYVVPKLTPFVKSMGGKLTWNVEILLAAGASFPVLAPKIFAGVALVAGLFGLLHYLPGPRYYLDLAKLRLPLIGSVFTSALVVHFARTFSLLLESGVPVLDSLRITEESASNYAAKKVLREMAERVLEGENLSAPLLNATRVFPPVVGTSVRVGEETGGVDTSLAMVARMYQELLEVRLKQLVNLIEPALIIFLGGIVAFVASAMICAIISSYGRLAG